MSQKMVKKPANRLLQVFLTIFRSEERRVGKEC